MLYVDPAFARRGVATALVDALVRLAAARGAKTLTAEVSDTARPLFERQGFARPNAAISSSSTTNGWPTPR